jgi:hypothetical protein
MKMLFSSSDNGKIERARVQFLAAGIACEVRGGTADTAPGAIPFYPELWVKHEADFSLALNLFNRMGARLGR